MYSEVAKQGGQVVRSHKIDTIINPSSLIVPENCEGSPMSIFNTPSHIQPAGDCPVHSMSISAITRLSNLHASNGAGCKCKANQQNTFSVQVKGNQGKGEDECMNYGSSQQLKSGK